MTRPFLSTLLLLLTPLCVLGQPAHMVKDINPQLTGGSSSPSSFVQVGGIVFFGAGASGNGFELWRTDGTAGGTQMLRDIDLGSQSSFVTCLQPYHGKLVFVATEESTGTQLWES